jgi:biopolymer transport protein ExbD
MICLTYILCFLYAALFLFSCEYRENEPVIIQPPTSHSEVIKFSNVTCVKIDSLGEFYFGVENKNFKKIQLNDLDALLINYKTTDSTRRFAIITARTVNYEKVKTLIKKLQSLHINSFNLISN